LIRLPFTPKVMLKYFLLLHSRWILQHWVMFLARTLGN